MASSSSPDPKPSSSKSSSANMTTSKLIIAITGGAGHIGTGVVLRALEEGHTVIALDIPPQGRLPDQPRYSYKQCDATDFDAYRDAVRGCTAIVHLAAVFNQHDDEGKLIDSVLQHEVHNANAAMSFNTLSIAAELGISRVALASSVNSIGMVFSKRPTFDYLPVDEKHPFRPEDAYSLSKYICEIQSDAFVRRYPWMRVASLRFHWVVPTAQVDRDFLHKRQGSWKDLWGWVSLEATAKAVVLSLTVPEDNFPAGTHESFFIVSRTTCQQTDSMELLKTKFPEITDFRKKLNGNDSFVDTSKAERILGWKEEGFPMET